MLLTLLACATGPVFSTQSLSDSEKGDSSVLLVSPGEGESVENPVTFEVQASGVSKVKLSADGYVMGSSWNPASTSNSTYWFSTTGTHSVVLSGYSSGGRVVATDTVTIKVLPADLNVQAPVDGQTLLNPVTFQVDSTSVDTVRVSADGWQICSWDAQSASSCTYDFEETGRIRAILVEGLDPNGTVLTSESLEITPVESGVSLVSPEGSTAENPVTFEFSSYGVAKTRLYADSYQIYEVAGDGLHRFTYTFSGTGYARTITLTGYDSSGRVVSQDTQQLTVANEGEVSLEVPYFYQYDNRYEPGSTCGVTSAAMMVNYWKPDSVTPDSLYLDYGKSKGQSPEGLASLFSTEGLFSRSSRSGTRSELKQHLAAGRPVVVHGYWTGSGHVTILVGYSDSDWIVNDPAGDWYTCYGCGEADHIRYPLGGAWDDELSYDGDIWYSTAASNAF